MYEQETHDPLTELRDRIEQIPSERDWEVYRLVRVKELSTRTVARKFGISQTRVCQLVERAAAVITAAALLLNKEDTERQLSAGRQLAAERVGYLYGEALRSFRLTRCTEKIIRQPHGLGKDGCTTIRPNYGDARYLQAAGRLAIMASTLPPPQLVTCELGPEKEPREKVAKNPMKEDCSAARTEQPITATSPTNPSSATAAAMLSCVEQSRGDPFAANTPQRPVQSPGKAARRQEFFQTG